MKKAKKRGFTLIELLVVVLIIGILAAVALPKYKVAVGRARVARALPLLRAVVEAKKRYYITTGQHTADMNVLDIHVAYDSVFTEEGAKTSYRGTPIGRIGLSTLGYGVYWAGPGLILDLYDDASRWKCYPEQEEIGKTGEKICASLGRPTGKTTAKGEPIYSVKF